MNRVFVSSSNLRAVCYDPNTRILQIEFLDGHIYNYFEVPASVHAALMSASSHGTYFDAYIKKGGYKFIKIR